MHQGIFQGNFALLALDTLALCDEAESLHVYACELLILKVSMAKYVKETLCLLAFVLESLRWTAEVR